MRRNLGWTGLRTSVVAFGLVAAAAGVTRADTMTSTLMAYDTVGSSIGTTGVSVSVRESLSQAQADPGTTTGTRTDSNGDSIPVTKLAASGDLPAITFVPLSGGAFMSPSSLNLGMFKATALADGHAVTFDHTPFDIKFTVDGVNGVSGFQPNGTPIDIRGELNGSLSGASQSSVVATFDKPAAAAFATGLYANTLAITNSPLSIVPSSSNGGVSTVQAMLTTQITPATPAPEPSTVVLFAATIAGLGFRHRLRRARAAAGC